MVNDGRLTIDAIGGTNTKINYVDIVEAPSGDDFGLKVNFQSDTAPVPAGYVRDFPARLTASAALASARPAALVSPTAGSSRTTAQRGQRGNGRDRNRTSGPALTDQRLDT